ncbi:MAG: hypothetical protein OEW45_18895 [Deltaproteobacteria bacterium]|nr:hypothetical protein [Deltaproteobacteria bacterium]
MTKRKEWGIKRANHKLKVWAPLGKKVALNNIADAVRLELSMIYSWSQIF